MAIYYRPANAKYTNITATLVGAETTDARGSGAQENFNTTGSQGNAYVLRDTAGIIIMVDTTTYNADYVVVNGYIRLRQPHFSLTAILSGSDVQADIGGTGPNLLTELPLSPTLPSGADLTTNAGQTRRVTDAQLAALYETVTATYE